MVLILRWWMGHSEVSEFVRSLFHLFLDSGPSVLSDAAHPLAPEMEIFSPKKKSNTGGLKRGVVPYPFSQRVPQVWSRRRTTAKNRGGQFIITASGLSQNSGVSAVVVACDVAITGHQTVIRQQLLSGNSSLGWLWASAWQERSKHWWVCRWTRKWHCFRGEATSTLFCFGFVHYLIW